MRKPKATFVVDGFKPWLGYEVLAPVGRVTVALRKVTHIEPLNNPDSNYFKVFVTGRKSEAAIVSRSGKYLLEQMLTKYENWFMERGSA